MSFSANAQPKVVVTLPALHSLVSMVMQNAGQPFLLLTRQQDSHHMQLRPSQMKAVLESDLFIYYDADFEIFVPKLMAAGNKHTLFLPLSAILEKQQHRPGDYGWLNPDYAIAMLHYIAKQLARIDPPQAALYVKNAVYYAQQLDKQAVLGRSLIRQTSNTSSYIATDHNAFIAFRQYFPLPQLIALEDAGGEISLKQLKRLEGKQVSCLMVTHGKSAIMTRLAHNGKARLITKINPLGSLYEPGPSLYFTLMEDLVNEFYRCLT